MLCLIVIVTSLTAATNLGKEGEKGARNREEGGGNRKEGRQWYRIVAWLSRHIEFIVACVLQPARSID
jgi:hypothetical protein